MKPKSCSPALAMARLGARAGSGVAGAEGGVGRCAPGTARSDGAARKKLVRRALLPELAPEKL